MKQVKSRNTKPERIVRKILWGLGFQYRLNVKSLPGSPDIANKKRKKAIFVNGCFWHGHQNCKKAKLPTSRVKYWEDKIAKNIDRDKKNFQDLKNIGYDVLIVWECETRKKMINYLTNKLIAFLENNP